MTDRIPKQPLNWRSLADERIRSAQAAGAFDNLPGFGKPIPGIDEPHDELWWVKQKLERENLSVLPPALALQLDRERTLAKIAGLPSEAQVRDEVAALNERIRKLRLGASGPSVNVLPLDAEEVVATWQASRNVQAPRSLPR
jgi:hypothetical protein